MDTTTDITVHHIDLTDDGNFSYAMELNGTGNSSYNDSDDYYYDYDSSVNVLPLTELIPVALVYGLTLLLGVLGNALVIFSILRYRRMQSVTNIFLTSLASADLIVVLICVPIKFAKWFTFTWEFGESLCKGVHYLQNVSAICSVLTLTTMSMERYYAILQPMRAKYICTRRRAKRVILVVWILSFLLAIPIIFGQVHKEVGWRRTAYWCIKEWKEPYSQIYEVGMLLLIMVIPVSIMSFAYISICRELWLVANRRQHMTGVKFDPCVANGNQFATRNHVGDRSSVYLRQQRVVVDDDSTRRQVIKMLVAVIVLFTICWGPTMVDNVLVAFRVLDKLHYGYLKHIRMAFVLMSYANSCVNPIVYAFMSRNFRESFKYALCMCLHGKGYLRRTHYRRQTSFHTRETSITTPPIATSTNCKSRETQYSHLANNSQILGIHDSDNQSRFGATT